MDISADHLEQVQGLYDRGLYYSAFKVAESIAPLKTWDGTSARILAGRLAQNLGAPRLGRVLHQLAYRSDPTDPEAAYYFVRAIRDRRGLLAAWEFQERQDEPSHAHPSILADYYALRAYIYGCLRDFDTAESWLQRAESTVPDQPWVCIERSYVFEMEDRYEESLAAAQRSLDLQPWYRPGVQATGHLLQLLDRTDEAHDLLSKAVEHLESPLICMQLAQLHEELGRHEEARFQIEEAVRMAPLMEKGFAEALAGMRSDAAYYCGDLDSAIELGKKSKNAFFSKITKRLENIDKDGRRVKLDVGFVRQHHMTCSPATLSMISQFWQMPVDHLEIAEEICYDGTPGHNERNWAERNGWATREFTVDWDAVISLIDSGIPFTLTTVRPGNAHLQAVIGYDTHRGTWLIRDPFFPGVAEAMADELMKDQRSAGPRGMAWVPRHKKALLDAVVLPDAELYDARFQIATALDRHDRNDAQRLCDQMIEAAPDHRLTLATRMVLAGYDQDATAQLTCTEALLQEFPDTAYLQLSKLFSLRRLSRRQDRLTLLEHICENPKADPQFWLSYAQEWIADARDHDKAIYFLRRFIKCCPQQAEGYHLLATIYSCQHRFEEAFRLYRFATCLDDKQERYAADYFNASRFLKRTDEVLEFLTKRFKRLGDRSSQPVGTLCWALAELDRTDESFDVLESAMERRPTDGELLLYAADAHARHGKMTRSSELFDEAEGKVSQQAWLRTAAGLARYRGALDEALASWKAVLQVDPLAEDAISAVANLLAAKEGQMVAIDYLRDIAGQYPNTYSIHRLLVEWLREEEPQAALEAVQHLIQIEPADVWARREAAWKLMQMRRLDEARDEAETACKLDPHDAISLATLGRINDEAGRSDEARTDFKRAICLSVDTEFAVAGLFALARNIDEKREVLAFIQEQLVQQVLFGNGLLAYRTWARGILQPEEQLATLQAALDARPDLWHAWAAVACQLREMGRVDDALSLTQKATDRFPLCWQLWQELAFVCQVRGDVEAEIAALNRALEIAPAEGEVARHLAMVYERELRLDDGRALLEKATSRDPLDVPSQYFMAILEWKQGRQDTAINRLKSALLLDPGHDAGWEKLSAWSHEQGHPEAATELAQHITTLRSGDTRAWLALARTLALPNQWNEKIAAIGRIIDLDPRCVEAYIEKAQTRVEQGRIQDAIEACRPPALGEDRPVSLRGCEAWVTAVGGDLLQAVDQMRAVVSDDPAYETGWSFLVQWLSALDEFEQAREAADHLVRLAPHSATGYTCRADIRVKCRDRKGAKADLRQAMSLDTDFFYAGFQLFELEMDDQAFDDAEAVLKILKTHSDGPHVRACEVHLAADRKDETTAAQKLQLICFARTDDIGPLQTAIQAMSQHGWKDRVQQVLQDALLEPEVNILVGNAWSQQFSLTMKRKECWRFLSELRQKGEAGWATTAAYLEDIAQAGQARLVRRFIRKHRREMLSNTATWQSVGFAFTTCGDFAQAVRWLSTWQQRDGITPTPLLNLAVSLRSLLRDKEAAEVSRHAMKLEPDWNTWSHELLIAMDAAFSGAYATAEYHLRRIPNVEMPPYYAFIQELIAAVLLAYSANNEDRRKTLREAKQHLRAARAAVPGFRNQKDLRRYHKIAIRQVSSEVGGILSAIRYAPYLAWG